VLDGVNEFQFWELGPFWRDKGSKPKHIADEKTQIDRIGTERASGRLRGDWIDGEFNSIVVQTWHTWVSKS
jgi:hypothetical protein